MAVRDRTKTTAPGARTERPGLASQGG